MTKMDPMMFAINLNTRMEFVHPADVARAIVNAIECEKAWGETYLVGGGKKCQIYYRDFIGGILNAVGIGALPEIAFGSKPFYTDWLDTRESQRLLNYQQLTFDDWLLEVRKALGLKAYLAKMFRPFARRSLLNSSPYWKEAKKKRRK
jgi:nucleoside-diphosphate-sugar epimerase